MANDMPTVAEAQAIYRAAHEAIADALRDRFSEPETLADMLVSVADEYGAEHAVERLFEAEGQQAVPALITTLTTRVETALEARDDLDRASSSERATNGPQIIHIHGARYEVDTDAMVLRGRDGATIALDVQYEQQPTPTMTQQMRAVAQVDLAESRTPETRERSR